MHTYFSNQLRDSVPFNTGSSCTSPGENRETLFFTTEATLYPTERNRKGETFPRIAFFNFSRKLGLKIYCTLSVIHFFPPRFDRLESKVLPFPSLSPREKEISNQKNRILISTRRYRAWFNPCIRQSFGEEFAIIRLICGRVLLEGGDGRDSQKLVGENRSGIKISFHCARRWEGGECNVAGSWKGMTER